MKKSTYSGPVSGPAMYKLPSSILNRLYHQLNEILLISRQYPGINVGEFSL